MQRLRMECRTLRSERARLAKNAAEANAYATRLEQSLLRDGKTRGFAKSNAKLKQSIRSMRRVIEDQNVKIEEYEIDLKDAERKIKLLKRALDDAQKDSESVSDRYSQKRDRGQKRLSPLHRAELQERISELSAALAANVDEIGRLRIALTEEQDATLRFARERSAKDSQIEELEKQVQFQRARADDATKMCTRHEESQQKLLKKIEDLSGESVLQKEEIERLREKIFTVEKLRKDMMSVERARASSLRDLREQKDREKRLLSVMHMTERALAEEKGHRKRAEDEAKQATDSKQCLEKQLEDLVAKIDVVCEESEMLQRENESLKKKVASVATKENEFALAVDRLKQSKDRVEKRKNALEDELKRRRVASLDELRSILNRPDEERAIFVGLDREDSARPSRSEYYEKPEDTKTQSASRRDKPSSDVAHKTRATNVLSSPSRDSREGVIDELERLKREVKSAKRRQRARGAFASPSPGVLQRARASAKRLQRF